jgi:hypothetical protein
MTPLDDTSPEARRILTDIYRRMPPERKWRLLEDAWRAARMLHESGFRLRQPGATDEMVLADWLGRTFHIPAPLELLRERRVNPEMGENLRVISHVLGVFQRLGVAYAVGGSWASTTYGQARMTQDIDVTVEPFPGREPAFVAHFDKKEYYLEPATVKRANEDRSGFNLIHLPSGFKVDVFIRKDRPFDYSVLQRRRPMAPGGGPVVMDMVSPEDVILLKLEWFRLGGGVSDRQWGDILNVMRSQGDHLDQAYLDQWAADLNVSDLLARVRQDVRSAP